MEPQAAITKTRYDKKESLAGIAAIRTLTISASPTRIREDKKVPIDEISSIIFSITGHYPGLFKAKIAQIYKNRFKSENLYKFCHFKGRKDQDKDENMTFEHGQMIIKKIIGTLRNFGNSINIWSDSYLNNSIIMVDFFGVVFPSLF